MRIIVPVKQVPETSAVRMDAATGTMVREGVEAILNPLDLYAVECALRIREQRSGEVIALSMGPLGAVSALREAISMGCDSAVLLSDHAFAGSDTWATSHVLAAAIRRIGAFDLVICGERATDGDTGQVGPAVAAFLDLPVTTYIGNVGEFRPGGLIVRRLIETGYETLEVQLPAVLTVVKEVADPRLPTLRGKRRARAADIPTWKPADLGVDPESVGLKGSPTRVVQIHHPKVTRQCEKVAASTDDGVRAAVDRLVEFLGERGLLGAAPRSRP